MWVKRESIDTLIDIVLTPNIDWTGDEALVGCRFESTRLAESVNVRDCRVAAVPVESEGDEDLCMYIPRSEWLKSIAFPEDIIPILEIAQVLPGSPADGKKQLRLTSAFHKFRDSPG